MRNRKAKPEEAAKLEIMQSPKLLSHSFGFGLLLQSVPPSKKLGGLIFFLAMSLAEEVEARKARLQALRAKKAGLTNGFVVSPSMRHPRY